MRIGILGSGNIGSTVARKLSAAGHTVKIANSRGPQSIAEFAKEIKAKAVSAEEVVADIDVLVLSIPLSRLPDIRDLVAKVADDVVIIDTSNYYPMRDAKIPALDEGQAESLWVVEQIGRPVIKAWNAVLAGSFADKGQLARSAGRIALPVAGEDLAAKQVGMDLVEATGFDAIDAGTLEESWRIQPGNPAFCTDIGADDLRLAFTMADRDAAPRLRDIGIDAIMAFGPHQSDDILHLYRALSRSPGR